MVIWISIDGMRHDYVDHYHLSFLSRVMHPGAYTRQLVPVFPSLTFPSHASEITGADVQTHGITSNTFYSPRATRRCSRLPTMPACAAATSLSMRRTCWM